MCQCDLTTNIFSFKMNISTAIPTASPTSGTATVTNPSVGGGQNYDTYWVSGSNLLPVTRENPIQDRRPNELCRASIMAKNCTERLPDEKKISLEKSKSKNTLTSWIVQIRSYMEDNGMNTAFRVYDPDLKYEVYLLYDWVSDEYGKVSKWYQTLTTTGVGDGIEIFSLSATLTLTILLGK